MTRGDVSWPTIPAMVRDAARRTPSAEAVVSGSRRVTYGELAAAVTDAALALIASGIGARDRVAVWAPNSFEWIVAALGITTAGGVLVPVNTRFKGTEAAYVLERSNARLLFTVRGFLDTDYPALLAQSGVPLPGLAHIVVLSGDDGRGAVAWADFLARGAAVSDADVDARVAAIGAGDPSDVVFTSGTTGSPKGVVMTHHQTLRAYLDWCDWAGLRAGDRYLIVNPFFHIFGYKAGVLASLMRGATIFPLAVFDTDVVCDIVERERITVFPGPPTLYQSLLDAPGRARHDISSLRLAVTGAADIPVELIRRVREELPFERILTGYGLTEAGTVTGSRPDDDFAHIATTVGVPWAGFEVRTVTQSGVDAAPGEPGEVLVRGDTVMCGYLDDPDATAAAIDADGFLHTGDLGSFDTDGYLRIVGRIKDMFIVGGFNAYPAEIENHLLRHPRVAQAAVIGVPDARLGEVGMAFIVATPGDALQASELIEWARAEMANFKVPRFVEFLDALPVNATGKVVKDALRARTNPHDGTDGDDRAAGAHRGTEDLMARVPVAEGVFTWPADDPQLIGSRCAACGIVTFPTQDSCPRCASTDMVEHLLARRGRLWAWTTQSFPPPSPPYTGPTGAAFVPFGIGYVDLGDVKVETHLTEAAPDALHHGMEMELALVPFRTDDDGNDVVTFAFRPVETGGS